MNKILNEQELEEFIKDNKIECFSIIIKIDSEKKLATYVIDGKKEVNAKYEEVIKYFDIEKEHL